MSGGWIVIAEEENLLETEMLPFPFRNALRSPNSELTGDVGLLVVEPSVTINERGGEEVKCEFDRLRECLLDYE